MYTFECRQILSYHIYCIFLDSDGQVRLKNIMMIVYIHVCIAGDFIIQPRNTRFCDANDKTVMEIRMADAKRLGVAGFMTEW